MKMKILFLMVSLTLVYSAPINEEHAGGTAEDMDHSIAKRTEEQIFFGNQQNKPRVKKADPETDPKGLVRALPVEELGEEEETQGLPEEYTELEPNEEAAVETKVEEKIKELPEGGIEKVVEKEEIIEPNETNEGKAEGVLEKEELLKAEPPVDSPLTSDETEGGDSSEGSGDLDEASEEMTYDYLQKLYNQAENRIQYPNDYYYPDYYLNYRKKRAADGGEDVVKRNHRAKRDLGYGDLSESYFPDNFGENQYYNEALRKRAAQEALDEAVAEELTPLLENYEAQEGGIPDRYDNSRYFEYFPDSPDSYERSPYDDSWDSDEEFGSLNRQSDLPYRALLRSQPTNYIPMKRQAMSFVPGIRRRSFNYPHSMEPGSHWGAFADTEKREEEAAYDRLYRLARALAERRSPYEPYWEEEEYKKK